MNNIVPYTIIVYACLTNLYDFFGVGGGGGVKTNYISYRDRSGDLHRDRHVRRRKSENKKGNILTHYITLPVIISIAKVLEFIQHYNINMVSLLIGI